MTSNHEYFVLVTLHGAQQSSEKTFALRLVPLPHHSRNLRLTYSLGFPPTESNNAITSVLGLGNLNAYKTRDRVQSQFSHIRVQIVKETTHSHKLEFATKTLYEGDLEITKMADGSAVARVTFGTGESDFLYLIWGQSGLASVQMSLPGDPSAWKDFTRSNQNSRVFAAIEDTLLKGAERGNVEPVAAMSTKQGSSCNVQPQQQPYMGNNKYAEDDALRAQYQSLLRSRDAMGATESAREKKRAQQSKNDVTKPAGAEQDEWDDPEFVRVATKEDELRTKLNAIRGRIDGSALDEDESEKDDPVFDGYIPPPPPPLPPRNKPSPEEETKAFYRVRDSIKPEDLEPEHTDKLEPAHVVALTLLADAESSKDIEKMIWAVLMFQKWFESKHGDKHLASIERHLIEGKPLDHLRPYHAVQAGLFRSRNTDRDDEDTAVRQTIFEAGSDVLANFGRNGTDYKMDYYRHLLLKYNLQVLERIQPQSEVLNYGNMKDFAEKKQQQKEKAEAESNEGVRDMSREEARYGLFGRGGYYPGYHHHHWYGHRRHYPHQVHFMAMSAPPPFHGGGGGGGGPHGGGGGGGFHFHGGPPPPPPPRAGFGFGFGGDYRRPWGGAGYYAPPAPYYGGVDPYYDPYYRPYYRPSVLGALTGGVADALVGRPSYYYAPAASLKEWAKNKYERLKAKIHKKTAPKYSSGDAHDHNEMYHDESWRAPPSPSSRMRGGRLGPREYMHEGAHAGSKKAIKAHIRETSLARYAMFRKMVDNNTLQWRTLQRMDRPFADALEKMSQEDFVAADKFALKNKRIELKQLMKMSAVDLNPKSWWRRTKRAIWSPSDPYSFAGVEPPEQERKQLERLITTVLVDSKGDPTKFDNEVLRSVYSELEFYDLKHYVQHLLFLYHTQPIGRETKVSINELRKLVKQEPQFQGHYEKERRETYLANKPRRNK